MGSVPKKGHAFGRLVCFHPSTFKAPSMFTRCCGAWLLCALVLFSAGCNRGPERATVRGKVSIDGKPLTTGNVMFWGADNYTGTAVIDKEGNYVLSDAPVGDAKITVTVPKPPPGGMAAMQRMQSAPIAQETQSVDPNDPSRRISIMGDMPSEIVQIPDKYNDPSTSGLVYSVKGGEQNHDINLTP
jgi:hypothetical protein